MGQKDKLNDYLLKLFEIYNSNSIREVYDMFLKYNVMINEYNKDISKQVSEISNSIKIINDNKNNIVVEDNNNSLSIKCTFKYKNNPTNKLRLLIPIFVENLNKIVEESIKFFFEDKINFKVIIKKNVANDTLCIFLDNYADYKSYERFFNTNEFIKNIIKSFCVPIMPFDDRIGVTEEIYPINYFNIFFHYLIQFFNNNRYETKNLEEFNSYLNNRYSDETSILMRNELTILIKNINKIINTVRIEYLFDNNTDLNISSIDENQYKLKLDDKKLIYFESVEGGMIIELGSEDYLNICYSKIYKNFIEKNSSIEVYSFFKNVYDSIINSNYKNIVKAIDFSKINSDIIYQQLFIISSGFFALKKLGFSLNHVYELIILALENTLKTKIEINKKNMEEKIIKKEKILFPFNIEYGNKVFDLSDGTKTTIKSYFSKNRILEYIPLNSTIFFKDGESVNGEKFLKNILDYIIGYDIFKDYLTEKISYIEYN